MGEIRFLYSSIGSTRLPRLTRVCTLDGGYLSSSLDIKKGVGEQLHYCIIFKKNPHMKLYVLKRLTRGHFSSRPEHKKVKFWKSEFYNSDFRFRLLAKKYNSKVFFFFSYSDQNVVKFDVKVKKHKQKNNSLIFSVWRQIWLCSDQNMKKRRTLCYYTFLQAF